MRRPWLFLVGVGMVLSLIGTPIEGAVIIQQLNAPTDLDLSGNIVYAINFGNNGSPTVGGVVFSQDQDYPAITLNVTGEGLATWWGPPPGTGDAGLNQLMNGLAYRYGTPPAEVSVNAGGIIIGTSYLLQIIGYEPENENRNIDIIVENNEIVTGYNPLFQQGGVVGKGGSVIKYDFIAADPILNIRMLSHGSASAISGFVLTEIPEPATLSLFAPNGGEVLTAGSAYTIAWSSTGSISNVTIEYSSDNGASFTSIDTVPNTGSYQWIIPVEDSNQCLILIYDADIPDVYDISDGVFTTYECQLRSPADLNHDCRIDFADFAIMAQDWLRCGNPFDENCTE